MRLSVIQTDPRFGDIRGNIQQACSLMEEEPANLYVLPELFASGYNFTDRDELEQYAEPATGQTFELIARFASTHACYIAYGFPERADQVYNSSSLVGPEGLVGTYRKVHLFYKETTLFAPGNIGFPVFDLPFGRVGMMICFDWIYPEAARSLTLQGAQVILHPSNLVLPHCPDAMVTRCLENRIFTATANRVGREDRGGIDLSFIGLSEIVSPRGEILKRLGDSTAGAGVADIDLSLANDTLNAYNHLLGDRRPDHYVR